MELTDWLIFVMGEIIQTAVWIIPLIAGLIMVKRGGEKPERFFLAGSASMVLNHLVTMIGRIHTQLIIMGRLSSDSNTTLAARIGTVNIVYSVFTSLLFLAGMVSLVYAFWLRFKKKAGTPVGDSAA